MADKKISELVSATVVNGVDFFAFVQGGTTLKMDFTTLFSKLPQTPIVLQPHEAPVSGALSTATKNSLVSSAAGTTNYTLAAGTSGLKKTIVCSSMAGTNAVVTVTGGTGVASLTFTAAGQSADLECINNTWYVLGSHGVTIA